MKKVLIIYKFLPQYRKDFFELLKDELAKENIELTLIYGRLKNEAKKDEIDLEWGIFIPNITFSILGRDLIWQPCLKHLKDKDLIIVEQANALLLNYYLLLRRIFLKAKFAYWGHGLNRQNKADSIFNKFKLLLIKKCDWWFAYTESVKQLLISVRYCENKITVVQNSIDTKYLRESYEKISIEHINELAKKLNIKSKQVAIYCGAIYKEKRIEFLLSAAELIKKEISEFHLIIIGSGPDKYLIESFCVDKPWIHYLGPKFGADKIAYFKMSKIFLMPGAIGLAILDAFALQTPMITTNYEFHGPEIDYLENNINGIITENDLSTYATNAVEVLLDNERLKILEKNCRVSSKKYSNENMVSNFKTGLLKCLNS